MPPINEQAVIVSFSVNHPTRAQKSQAGLIKELASTARYARAGYAENSLPWWEASARLLPLANYSQYVETMTAWHAQYNMLLAELAECSVEARKHGVEYATLAQKHITWENQTRPMSDRSALPAAMSMSDAVFIWRDIERRTEEGIDLAMAELWNRLKAEAAHVSDRMRSYAGTHEGSFHSRSLVRVSVSLERLKRLDIGMDENFSLTRSEMARIVNNWTPEELRASAIARQMVAAVAERITTSNPGPTVAAMAFGDGA